MESLLTRYADRIDGVLSCFDRMLISGTLVEICYAGAATVFLKRRRIKIFDFEERFAVPIRDEIRERAEAVAAETSARKTRSGRSWRSEGIIPDWSMFSQLWRPTPVTGPGSTRS